jgi:hypothetical protein
MLHAVAMPIDDMDSPDNKVEISTTHHMGIHCDNMAQEDLKAQNCCFNVALDNTTPLLPLVALYFSTEYVPLTSLLIRHIPDTLFKPPKFYLA